MQKTLLIKCTTIGILVLLLLIPLMTTKNLVNERQQRRENVIADIGKSASGQQTIMGPILVVPYIHQYQQEESIYENGQRKTIVKTRKWEKVKYIIPEQLSINGDVTMQARHRGIYKIPMYQSELRLEGNFNLPKHAGIKEKKGTISLLPPYLAIGISDTRGISHLTGIKINQKNIPFAPNTKLNYPSNGIHADLTGIDFGQPQKLTFNSFMQINGLETLSFVPVGKQNTTYLTSDWPHPHFSGTYLPTAHHINDQGFTSQWNQSILATNIGAEIENCMRKNKCTSLYGNAYSVSFLEGVDLYQKVERSIKYALLIICISFIIFFLFEMLKQCRVHPFQYGMVGLALAFFYILFLSLSEHMALAYAYSIAATLCVGLIGFYASFILRSKARGASISSAIAGLYGVFYLLIKSEDYALVTGSLVTFLILALIMVITRKVDWYQIERPEPSGKKGA